jgi:hypothetical protein
MLKRSTIGNSYFTVSQRRQILSLYLKSYFLSKVTRMCIHYLYKLDRYLSDFERMCDVAKKRGFSAP